MPTERSCGAIIFRREEKEIKYLFLHYEAGHWDFVKGNVEKGESEKETTIREINEETSINDIHFIEKFKEKVHWFYKREGKTIYKEVIYFLAETKQKGVKLSYEHIGYEWLNYDDAIKRLKFKNSREILGKANKLLTQNKSLAEY